MNAGAQSWSWSDAPTRGSMNVSSQVMSSQVSRLLTIKSHRGEPGHTRDTHGRTRAHGSHRQTSQPSQPTNAPTARPHDDNTTTETAPNRGRLNSRSPGTATVQPRSRPHPAADSKEANPTLPPPAPRGQSAWVTVLLLSEFGYICYQDTYPMYRACILHVFCMYLDVSRSYTSRYIKIHQDTSRYTSRYIKIHQDTFVSFTLAIIGNVSYLGICILL